MVKVKDSLLLVDSASATTNLYCPVETTPLGGVTLILDRVKFTVPPAAVYKMGLPGIPKKAELPVAAPLHAGAATGIIVSVPGELPERVNEKIEPSDNVIENSWPPPKTVALL